MAPYLIKTACASRARARKRFNTCQLEEIMCKTFDSSLSILLLFD